MSLTMHTIDVIKGSQTTRQDRLLLGLLNSVAMPASANSVTVLGAITPGTGFTNISTVSIAPTGGTGSGLTVIPTSLKAVSAAVVNQGTSGYSVSDTITLTNGVVLTVATVSSGKVTTVTVSTAGAFTGQVATNPVAQASTSGSGVGTPTFTVAYGLGAAQITNSGNYSVVPTGLTVTDSASGTGASIAAPTLGGNGNGIYVFIPFTDVPSSYSILLTPGFDCRFNVPPSLKTNLGFSVEFVPTTTGSTLSAGTFDLMMVA